MGGRGTERHAVRLIDKKNRQADREPGRVREEKWRRRVGRRGRGEERDKLIERGRETTKAGGGGRETDRLINRQIDRKPGRVREKRIEREGVREKQPALSKWNLTPNHHFLEVFSNHH